MRNTCYLGHMNCAVCGTICTDEQASQLSDANEGCWFDCSRGRYVGCGVIDAARSYGWDHRGYADVCALDDDERVDHDAYYEAWDDADQYLCSIAPEGFWIGATENGDYGMWPNDEEDDTSDDPESDVPVDGDYVISDCGPLGSRTHVGIVNGPTVGEFATEQDAHEYIRALMGRDQVWPNVWRVSDHGNVSLATF